MAGTEKNSLEDLSMDMIQMGGIKIPEEAVTTPEELVDNSNKDKNINNVIDGTNSQESVDNSTDESTSNSEESVNNNESPADDDVFKTFANFLSDKGLITVQEDELLKIKSDDDFAEVMRKQIKANEYADLTDKQKKYLEAVREGIPQESFHDNLQSQEAFAQLTDELIKSDSEVRKELILEGIKAKGFDEAYALKHFKRVSDSGEDVEEAILFRGKLKEAQDLRYQKEVEDFQTVKKDNAVARQKQVDDLKESVYSKDKIFDGFSITKGIQDKVYSLITKAVAHTEEGIPLNALMHYQQEHPTEFQTNIHYLFELTDGFKNLKKFETKAATKATNYLKSKLQKSNYITESSSNPSFDNSNSDMPVITDVVD